MPTRNLFPCVDARILGNALASVLLLTACGDDSNPTPSDDSTGTSDPSGDPSTSPSTTISTSTNPSTTNPSTTGDTETDGTSSTGGEESTTSSATADTETTTTGRETESSTTSAEMCGNDMIEGDEECDGTDLGEQDCESLDFDGGDLACDGSCAFDTSGCFTMTCGNDTLEGKEVCDGTELDGETCESQGMGGGELACLKNCSGFDFGGCGGEDCVEEDIGNAVGASVTSGTTAGEDENLAQVCADGGAVDHVISWTAPAAGVYVIDTDGSGYDTALAVYTDCESPEIACDDDDGLTGAASRLWVSVEDAQVILISVNGYSGATGNWVLNINLFDATGPCCGADQTAGCNDPACTSTICNGDNYCCDVRWDGTCAGNAATTCEICTTPDICGNGVTEMGETCDTPDVGGETCQTQGFDAGTLVCAEDCSAIDDTGCITFEGDCCTAHGAAEPGCDDDACYTEVCAANPACCTDTWTQACADAALATCDVCFVPDICGNGVIDGTDVCDGTELGAETCQTQGFDAGTLTCAPDCATLDTTECVIYEGDCCASDATPGCDEDVCTAAVCGADPFCCDTAWDTSCANQALGLCGECGGGIGDCCTETGDVGCEDPTCVEIICGFGGLNSTCCTTDWTSTCTDLATANCPVCM